MNTFLKRPRKSWLFALVASLSACSVVEKRTPAWPLGVKYEVFVLAFADGNGDGKGDILGLMSKLNHLEDLGVNGVWLMPVMNSPSYHKYDVTDYKSIHPDYGTIEDFKEFVKAAHSKDIRVIVDLVINHTSNQHSWFREASSEKTNPFRNYYVWAKKDSIRSQISKKTSSFDSDNITQWHAVNGDTTSEHYYGFFWGGMPDLNFDSEKVMQEFVDISKFWLEEMDVDGFRLDAAAHIFPGDRAADNHRFWNKFRTEMQKIKPDVYLVGEVWLGAKEVAPYLEGLPSLFNFDMSFAITSVVKAGMDTIGLIKKYIEITDFYKSVNPTYLDATFLTNHDQNRILSQLGDHGQKMRVAAGILLTLPGTPYIYYGEEIGMKGVKPDEYIREPFLWATSNADAKQTSWEQPKYSNEQTVLPLSEQKKDHGSLYNFYRELIRVRNGSKALTMGELEKTNFSIAEVISFKRKYENEELLVLNNISDVEITISLSDENEKFDEVLYDSNKTATLDEGELTLPAYSTVILK
ncbi:MAG TPA: alpha-amylase family glycosyl hydrolase [Chryseolinea sp.]|nr:alpha-amylase family glycosyl hydrolase [Chryseolinea sp.]